MSNHTNGGKHNLDGKERRNQVHITTDIADWSELLKSTMSIWCVSYDSSIKIPVISVLLLKPPLSWGNYWRNEAARLTTTDLSRHFGRFKRDAVKSITVLQLWFWYQIKEKIFLCLIHYTSWGVNRWLLGTAREQKHMYWRALFPFILHIQ